MIVQRFKTKYCDLFAGGNDKNVTVFNKDTTQVICILEGHTKKVTKVIYHPEEVSKYNFSVMFNSFIEYTFE